MVCAVRQNHLRFSLQRRCKHRLFAFPCRLCFCCLCFLRFLYFLCFLGFPLLLRLRNLDCFALYRCHRLFLLQGLAAPCFFSVHGAICHPCAHRQQAKAAAKALIDSGEFELYYTSSQDNDPGRNYRDLFRYLGEQNKERILFRDQGCNDIWFRNMGTVMGGQGVSAPLKSLVDVYETIDGKTIQSLSAEERLQYERNPLYKARDPRLYATVMMPEDSTSISNYVYHPFDPNSSDFVGKTGASRSGYMLKKYLDEQDRATGRGTLDFMIYRYAEVLMDYVECLIETGDWQNPDVEKYINMIRNRAGMPNMDKSVYNTQEKVRELYRRERRIEFAFEGKRYDDIRRWGIGNETNQGTIYGAWNPNEGSYVTIETRNCVFPKFDSWPLHQQEVTANPNIKQPTGW